MQEVAIVPWTAEVSFTHWLAPYFTQQINPSKHLDASMQIHGDEKHWPQGPNHNLGKNQASGWVEV